jgi:hypothetical protein
MYGITLEIKSLPSAFIISLKHMEGLQKCNAKVKGVIHDQKQNKYKYSLCFSKNNS